MLCSPPPLHHHLLLPAALGCAVTCSLRSFSSDRSNTLNRSSFARDSMMIEEILAPTKDTVRSNFCLIIFYFFSLFLSPVFALCSLFFCLVVTLSSPDECVFPFSPVLDLRSSLCKGWVKTNAGENESRQQGNSKSLLNLRS